MNNTGIASADPLVLDRDAGEILRTLNFQPGTRRTILSATFNMILFPLFWAIAAVALEHTDWGQHHFSGVDFAAAALALCPVGMLTLAWYSHPHGAAWLQLSVAAGVVVVIVLTGRPKPFAVLHLLGGMTVSDSLLLIATVIVLGTLAVVGIWSWRRIRSAA